MVVGCLSEKVLAGQTWIHVMYHSLSYKHTAIMANHCGISNTHCIRIFVAMQTFGRVQQPIRLNINQWLIETEAPEKTPM